VNCKFAFVIGTNAYQYWRGACRCLITKGQFGHLGTKNSIPKWFQKERWFDIYFCPITGTFQVFNSELGQTKWLSWLAIFCYFLHWSHHFGKKDQIRYGIEERGQKKGTFTGSTFLFVSFAVKWSKQSDLLLKNHFIFQFSAVSCQTL